MPWTTLCQIRLHQFRLRIYFYALDVIVAFNLLALISASCKIGISGAYDSAIELFDKFLFSLSSQASKIFLEDFRSNPNLQGSILIFLSVLASLFLNNEIKRKENLINLMLEFPVGRYYRFY